MRRLRTSSGKALKKSRWLLLNVAGWTAVVFMAMMVGAVRGEAVLVDLGDGKC